MVRTPSEMYVELGDATLCVWHWPGQGIPILMLHATGFHARCWDAVIDDLPENPVYAVDLRFHGNSSKSGEVSWPLMAKDIRALVDKLNLAGMVGVGHSIGGYLLTLVAANASSRFRELLLLDPVIMDRQRYAFAKQMETVANPADHPGAKRRNAWQSPDEMVERFKSRKPFDTWDARVLQDYCDHALTPPDSDGVRCLLCDPLHEAQIYIRHDGDAVHTALSRLDVPTTVLRAREPTEKDSPFDFTVSPTWPDVAAAMQKGTDIYLPEHTHFIPMENPGLVARHITRALKA